MLQGDDTSACYNNITSFYGSSCADDGKDALNTPETLPVGCYNVTHDVTKESHRVTPPVIYAVTPLAIQLAVIRSVFVRRNKLDVGIYPSCRVLE
eukprot:6533374-Pyramimonas_sp.AAC.1